MEPLELENYLLEHIPLSRALGVRVIAVDAGGAVLEAPLEPNLNHRGTAFGGSLSALALLAGWALIHSGLRREGLERRLVIHRHEVDFTAPATDTLRAHALAPAAAEWEQFVAGCTRRGRSRLAVDCRLSSAGKPVGACLGRYVALATD